MGDVTACRTTQVSIAVLSQPPFQAVLAKSMKTFQYFWFVSLTELFLANRTFKFFLNIVEKVLTTSHEFTENSAGKYYFSEKRKSLDVTSNKAFSFNGILRGLGIEFNLIIHAALFAYGNDRRLSNYTLKLVDHSCSSIVNI